MVKEMSRSIGTMLLTSSAPYCLIKSAFLLLHTPTTFAPNCFAICTAPPLAPNIKTFSPYAIRTVSSQYQGTPTLLRLTSGLGSSPLQSSRAVYDVRTTRGKLAASTWDTLAGLGRSREVTETVMFSWLVPFPACRIAIKINVWIRPK